MNYTKILKRAWHILWHYPALWVFGFLMAFFGASSSGDSPSNGLQYSFNKNDFPGWNGFQPDKDGSWNLWLEKINRFFDAHFGAINEKTMLMWAGIAILVIFFLVVLGTIINYIAKTAHIRMVNHLEESGEKVSWRKGFKWGWSASAFRLWLIDLLVTVPTIFVFLVLFGCAAIPILLGSTAGEATTAAGVVATIGIALVIMLLAFIVGLVINLWLKIAHRVCVIEGLGVIESLKNGWKCRSQEPERHAFDVVDFGWRSDWVWYRHDPDRVDCGWFVGGSDWWGWITHLFSGNQCVNRIDYSRRRIFDPVPGNTDCICARIR